VPTENLFVLFVQQHLSYLPSSRSAPQVVEVEEAAAEAEAEAGVLGGEEVILHRELCT
tara:strand:- start:1734 stop:1907 length:174 start_codon:yes stop_codon:yes gene_type:complete